MYSDLLNSMLSFHQEPLRSATQIAQNNLLAAQQGTEVTSKADQKNTETVRRAYNGS